MPTSVKGLMMQSARSSSDKVDGACMGSPTTAYTTTPGAATRLSEFSEDGSSCMDPGSPSSRSTSRLDLEEAIAATQPSVKMPIPPSDLGHQDGERLDADFSDICRMTVAVQRGAMLANTFNANRHASNDHVVGGESLVTTTPSRLLDFFARDGAVYSQYDLSRRELAGGALPAPWKAVRSKTTGKVYYYNEETQESKWEPPLYPLHHDWVAETSPQTGAVFYVNKFNGKWQWERPVDEHFLDLQGAGHSDAEALRMWRERHGQVDLGLAGLEDVEACKVALSKLPAPTSDADAVVALTAPSADAG